MTKLELLGAFHNMEVDPIIEIEVNEDECELFTLTADEVGIKVKYNDIVVELELLGAFHEIEVNEDECELFTLTADEVGIKVKYTDIVVEWDECFSLDSHLEAVLDEINNRITDIVSVMKG